MHSCVRFEVMYTEVYVCVWFVFVLNDVIQFKKVFMEGLVI